MNYLQSVYKEKCVEHEDHCKRQIQNAYIAGLLCDNKISKEEKFIIECLSQSKPSEETVEIGEWRSQDYPEEIKIRIEICINNKLKYYVKRNTYPGWRDGVFEEATDKDDPMAAFKLIIRK